MKISLVERVCSWCKKSMGFKGWIDQDDAPKVTHGICDDCVKKLGYGEKNG